MGPPGVLFLAPAPSRALARALTLALSLALALVGCTGRTQARPGVADDILAIATTSASPNPIGLNPPAPTTPPIKLGPSAISRVTIPEPIRAQAPWYPKERVGEPYSSAVPGVLTFRGSPNRSFHGIGPVPANPEVKWSYPDSPMCAMSEDQHGVREWCGTGWTGQPAVWERGGRLWLAFGAFDRSLHVLDARSGHQLMDPFPTGDLIKGSVTVDPDGHPLIYFGSRDNHLRVVSFDQAELVELWSLEATAVEPRLWNNDWDGAPVVIDDYLFVGGENSNFHVVELNRSYDRDRRVRVDPELVVAVPGWDQELRAAVGDNVSIESSVTIVDDIVYFANSGGLVQGWDIGSVADRETPDRVFRFWMGDDTDATVVLDDAGYLYAASEYERGTERSRQLGQVVKLDPNRPDEPVVWSVDARTGPNTGVWATPAVHRDIVIVPTADGRVLGIARETGDIRWTIDLPGPLWSSPVVVDDTLIQGDCEGRLSAFDLTQTETEPALEWSVVIGGCIESTPVVWEGGIWVGTRGGYMHHLADAD